MSALIYTPETRNNSFMYMARTQVNLFLNISLGIRYLKRFPNIYFFKLQCLPVCDRIDSLSWWMQPQIRVKFILKLSLPELRSSNEIQSLWFELQKGGNAVWCAHFNNWVRAAPSTRCSTRSGLRCGPLKILIHFVPHLPCFSNDGVVQKWWRLWHKISATDERIQNFRWVFPYVALL